MPLYVPVGTTAGLAYGGGLFAMAIPNRAAWFDAWGQNSTMTPVLNTLYLFPMIVGRTVLCDSLIAKVTTAAASSFVRVGHYQATDAYLALIQDAGQASSAGVGFTSNTFTAVRIPAGQAYGAFVLQGATGVSVMAQRVTASDTTESPWLTPGNDLSVGGNPQQDHPKSFTVASVTGALPSTIAYSEMTLGSTIPPWIAYRVAASWTGN
jgi:hypothetical protein